MSTADAQVARAFFSNEQNPLRGVTFPSLRLAIARSLVIFCFVWPFFNYTLLSPDSTVEINFLPVILAALILPEISFREKWSILLALPVFIVALIWANPTAPARLAIGIIPLHFVLNLTRHLREQGQDLVPPNLAYRALQAFVGLCILQTIEFRLFPIIPEWLTSVFVAILPRYSGVPGEDFGIRGVQGWASEPSGAALTCIAFALVAILQRPDRRWRVLALYAIFVTLNKSIYAMVLATVLGLICLFSMRRKLYSLLALVPMFLTVLLYLATSNRVAELRTNISIFGLDRESNNELQRFAQIFYPLQQFPHVYTPVTLILNGHLFGMEPIGLLPLVSGYGSVFGLLWVAYIMWRNFPLNKLSRRPLALFAAFILLMMTPADLIPSLVALALFAVPRSPQAPPHGKSVLVPEAAGPGEM